MTKPLEEAIELLRRFPENVQDSAARAILYQFEEEPEPGDREAITEGRSDFEHGNFVTLEQWRQENLGTTP
jgi:hypothetical protein